MLARAPRPVSSPPLAPADGAAPEETLGRLGALRVRLARSDREIEAAQRLRCAVFVHECGASPRGREGGREGDALDAACDHLLVLDGARLIGTTRLLRGTVARERGGHYTDREFDLAPLLARQRHRRLLELGRTCIHPEYRDRRTIELLWHGVWAYALRHGCDAMLGCASFPGLDPDGHAGALGFLARHAAAPPEWSARGRGPAVPMACYAPRALPPRAALRALPPLLKGYLRLGARVGPDLVPDPDFRCLDALVTLPREAIAPRYLRHYGEAAERFG